MSEEPEVSTSGRTASESLLGVASLSSASSSTASSLPGAAELYSFSCKVHKSNKQLPQTRVTLRIDEHGVLIVDPKRSGVLARYIFEDIVSWASSSGTFAFEISAPKAPSKKDGNLRFLFTTKEGIAIAEAMNKSVSKIVAEEERKFELEERRYREELEKLEAENKKRAHANEQKRLKEADEK